MKKALLASLMCVCVLFAESDDVEGAVSFEVGIGYLNGGFTSKQSGFYNGSTKGSARGVDIYVAANSYVTERFGLSLGMGAEFLNGDWNNECSGVGAYSYSYAREVVNLYLSKNPNADNSQRDKEELAAIQKITGITGTSPDDFPEFNKDIKFDSEKTGSQGYLYKSADTGDEVLKRYKTEITYTDVGAGKGSYDSDATSSTGYKYVGSGNGSFTRTSDYVYVTNGGTGKNDYDKKTDTDGSVTGTAGKEYYEYVGENKGTYSLVEEEYLLYRYNGTTLNSTGLHCSTPRLNVKTWYMFLGAFYDVVRFEYFGVRVFGNVGVGYDMMKDQFNRATSFYDAGTYQMFYTYNSNQTPSQEQGSVYMPLTAGVRFIIANNHGIELVGKYNLIKSKWKSTQHLYSGDFDGKNQPQAISVDTKITRDYSWGIRYVYEFR